MSVSLVVGSQDQKPEGLDFNPCCWFLTMGKSVNLLLKVFTQKNVDNLFCKVEDGGCFVCGLKKDSTPENMIDT